MKGKSKIQSETEPASLPKALPRLPILLMMFVSGFAGLVYQVLWMKQLGLLFGNTAHATSITLATFFAGIGFGSWWWGKITSKSTNPVRLYAILEIGIVITALLYYVILKIFYAIYPNVYELSAGSSWLIIIKFALSLLLIFPAAFFMGGTIPAIGQAMIRHRKSFGSTSSFIYGTNTLGAASGVACAAFTLIPKFGFSLSYAIAVSLSASVAALSWWLSRKPEATLNKPPQITPQDNQTNKNHDKNTPTAPSLNERLILILCFFSGFSVLALEVLWTRIFAQVHENSVYSFAIILTVVLVCLAIGSWLSSILAKLKLPPLQGTAALILIGGAFLLINPWMLMQVTNDLQPIYKPDQSWDDYVSWMYGIGFRGIGFLVIALGTVFPFLMKATEQYANQPGKALGKILAANTLGAIIGALICGFILLPTLGIWRSMQLITAGYLIIGIILPLGKVRAANITRAGSILCLILLFTTMSPVKNPAQGKPHGSASSQILQTWESSDCTVTATKEKNGNIAIKINGAYSLGSTQAFSEQANQSRIPLMIHPNIQNIFNLGFGTGMSAGASLSPQFPNIKKVTSCELTKTVVDAAKSHIPPQMTGGVFTDPRSKIIIEDGRHHLMASSETYDMINADLFLPYRRGAGSLYSLDHYQTVAKRLNPNGIFVQWLPLYQITETEFGVIARTMLEAFSQVTIWRNNFTPGREKIALIGQLSQKPIPIPPAITRQSMLQQTAGKNWHESHANMIKPTPSTILFHYIGNLTAASNLFTHYPINTDDKPIIEYQTPLLFRQVAAKDKVIWMVGPKLIKIINLILLESPIMTDPMLAGHPDASRRLAIAGKQFHKSLVAKALNNIEESEEAWFQFNHHWHATADGK